MKHPRVRRSLRRMSAIEGSDDEEENPFQEERCESPQQLLNLVSDSRANGGLGSPAANTRSNRQGNNDSPAGNTRAN